MHQESSARESIVVLCPTYARLAHGTRLYVHPFNEHRRRKVRPGYATYLGEVSIGQRFGFTKPSLMRTQTPRFKMQTGEIVYGIECAWTTTLLLQNEGAAVMQFGIDDETLEICKKHRLFK